MTHDVAEAVVLADRMIVLDAGQVALDLAITLPRPRRHGHPDLAGYEQQILAQLFGDDAGVSAG